jgi:hypothetical protein
MIAPASRRRVRLLVGLYVLAACAWALHCPERPDRVFRALPANCALVSEHADLARAWTARLSQPWLLQGMERFGMRHPEKLATDPGTLAIVRLVSGRRSLVGWSPALGPSARPAWVGASWVGLRGRLLQAMLRARWIPGLGRLQRSAGGSVYLPIYSDKDRTAPDLALAFALRENVLLATLGPDPDAVRTLDWRMSCDAPVPAVFGAGQPWRERQAGPMFAWVLAESFVPTLGLTEPLCLEVETWSDAKVRLTVRATPPAGAWDEWRLQRRCTALEAMPDAPPGALAVLPAAAVRHALDRLLPGMLPVVSAAPAEDACLTLAGQPYGGRLVGISLPALTLFLPWTGGGLAWVPRATGLLNARLKAGLAVRAPDPPVPGRTLVDCTRLSIGGRTRDADCLAIEDRPGWLAVASSAGSLDAQREAAVNGQAAWRGAWTQAKSHAGAAAFFWADLPFVAREARRLAAVYRLVSVFSGSPDEKAGALANEVLTALDACASAGRIAVVVSQAGSTWRAEVEMGGTAAPAPGNGAPAAGPRQGE